MKIYIKQTLTSFLGITEFRKLRKTVNIFTEFRI